MPKITKNIAQKVKLGIFCIPDISVNSAKFYRQYMLCPRGGVSVVRGWSNYFRSSCVSKVFSRIDDYMFHRLWYWACKRHPNKGVRWIKSKYFRRYGNNSWRFATPDGKLLGLHSDIRFKRHVKIEGTHSPFDGDIEYWKKRNAMTAKSERCI